ncbi:MAG: aminoacyl-tRNA hydrolase [Acidimicrobiia bacterium]
MRLVCGLRNPGSDYKGTRHNLGYEVLLALVTRSDSRLKRGPLRVRAEVATILGRDLILAAPNTAMNHSGRAVSSLLSYFKIAMADLLVLHDDIDLAFGRLRVQKAGGSGGHNGIRSLETHLGTKDFWRLKLGVGRPPGNQDPAEFVLRRFTKAEREEVELMVVDAADVVERWLEDPARAQEQAAHRRPQT